MLPIFSSIMLPALAASATITATSGKNQPRIVVVGHGLIISDPDVVTLAFSIRGEGSTSDMAAADLVRKKEAVNDGLAKILGAAVPVNTGQLSIKASREKTCDHDDDQPQLSTGSCAIRGYVATVDESVRISPLRDAGTALSLAGRLGATDPQLTDFRILNADGARQRAEAAAIEDAHHRASGIASASGARLGGLISVEDEEARGNNPMDIVVTATRGDAPPAVDPLPITINLRPGPIETTATLTVAYAVEP